MAVADLIRSPAQAKHGLVWVATVRVVMSIVALPLAPFLFRRHFVILTLLRPSQGVLLAGAFLARTGHVFLPTVLAAAIPLQVLVMWLYFALGRAWAEDIDRDDDLPFLTARILNHGQIRKLRDVLKEKGARVVFLARFAIAPTGLIAATVGASEMNPRRYLVADGAGLLLATAASVGAGYVLGIAQDAAGPWLVAVGLAALLAASGTLTWLLRRD
jgi:membrane protein DedA with SNARE-associated domain